MANPFGSKEDLPYNLIALAGFAVLGAALIGYVVAFILWPGDTFFWTAIASMAWWLLRHPIASLLLLVMGVSQ